MNRKKGGKATYYSRIFVNVPFSQEHGIHICYGYRGVYSSFKFAFQGAVPLQAGPRNAVQLSLQGAARHRLHQTKALSLVRQSGALASKVCSTDFSRLLMAPHLLASLVGTPNNLLHTYAPSEQLAKMLFPLSKPSTSLGRKDPPERNPFERLQHWWAKYGRDTLERKLERADDLRNLLKLVHRHDMPALALDVFRYAFYYTLTFEENTSGKAAE